MGVCTCTPFRLIIGVCTCRPFFRARLSFINLFGSFKSVNNVQVIFWFIPILQFAELISGWCSTILHVTVFHHLELRLAKTNSDIMMWTLCRQLLGNILSWHGLVGTQLLQRLALDGLLNRYIVLGLANSHVNRHSMEKCQAVSVVVFC